MSVAEPGPGAGTQGSDSQMLRRAYRIYCARKRFPISSKRSAFGRSRNGEENESPIPRLSPATEQRQATPRRGAARGKRDVTGALGHGSYCAAQDLLLCVHSAFLEDVSGCPSEKSFAGVTEIK